ncbi:MAG: DUF3786 domain-containing protein [Desulfomonilaceae bacterium]
MGCAAPNRYHWQDLRKRPIEEILNRDGVKIFPDGCFSVSFLNSFYKVDPLLEQITEISPNPNRILREEFQILLIRYLVAPNGGPVDAKKISEKDLAGGVTFFQGPHTLNTAPIAAKYGSDGDGFVTRGFELGAERESFGDRSMTFYPFPKIPVTYVLWLSDSEFPASVSVMFDSSIERWFQLDMIFTLVLTLTDRILEEP